MHGPGGISALGYYSFAAAMAMLAALFAFTLFYDGAGEGPWAIALMSAICVLTGTIVVREVIVRKKRRRLEAARQLDRNLEEVSDRIRTLSAGRKKFTLEQNALILNEIRQKSEAAKVLSKLSDGHREVVAMCDEYLAIAAAELPRIGPGSPRLSAIKKGSEMANRYHRYHMLKWAELEAQAWTREAGSGTANINRIPALERAIGTVELALNRYPNEQKLADSHKLLEEFLVTTRAAGWIELAERAFFKDEFAMAIGHYRDALYDLEKLDSHEPAREEAIEKIKREIDRIGEIAENK